MLTAKIYLHARRRRMQVVSEIKNFGEEGWWSIHFQCIIHSKFLKTTSVILPAKVKRISNPIFTSDLEIGFLASRNGSSGHLLKPAKVKWISNPIFTSDLEIGFLASRNGSSGHLLKLGLKVSRPLLVKLEIEAVDCSFLQIVQDTSRAKVAKKRSMPFRNSHQKTNYSGCGSPQNNNGSSVGHRHWEIFKLLQCDTHMSTPEGRVHEVRSSTTQ